MEQSDHRLEVPLVAHGVEAMAAFFIKVQFLFEVLGGCATLDAEIECNVLVIQAAGQVERILPA